MARCLVSWGRLPTAPAREERWWTDRAIPLGADEGPFLAYGNGRSYGDVCLNREGVLLHTRGMDRFIDFDAARGVLTCESGVLLSEILEFFVPRGWFLPVTPGTRFVTLGGALACDVHGKNHHAAGSFGCHVIRFELLRSDGTRRVCSREHHADWFAATVGGLGLTGLITWVELALKPISSVRISVENFRFSGLDEFFAINTRAEAGSEYTVAWIDCLSRTPRGVIMAGKHAAPDGLDGADKMPRSLPLKLPAGLPFSLINKVSLRLFNTAYYNYPLSPRAEVHFAPFFYPLDRVPEWNRLYGRSGFFQYQFVLPMASHSALDDIMSHIAGSGQGSFLAVLKTFGAKPASGLLSFPMPGITLALDFPNQGAATLKLFERLDAIVDAAGGRLYAAKDARMRGEFFRRSYPNFEVFLKFVDPGFSSDFWRRMLA